MTTKNENKAIAEIQQVLSGEPTIRHYTQGRCALSKLSGELKKEYLERFSEVYAQFPYIRSRIGPGGGEVKIHGYGFPCDSIKQDFVVRLMVGNQWYYFRFLGKTLSLDPTVRSIFYVFERVGVEEI